MPRRYGMTVGAGGVPTTIQCHVKLCARDREFVVTRAEALRCKYIKTLLEVHEETVSVHDGDDNDDGDDCIDVPELPLHNISAATMERLVSLIRCDDLPGDPSELRDDIMSSPDAVDIRDIYPTAEWPDIVGDAGSDWFVSLCRAVDMCMFDEAVWAMSAVQVLAFRGKTVADIMQM